MTKGELQAEFTRRFNAINDRYPDGQTKIDSQTIFDYQSEVIQLLLATCLEIIDMLPDTPPDASPVTPLPCTSQDGGK